MFVAGIRSSEYQAVGLGGYRDAPLTENRYRAERNKIDGHKGEISGDGTMKQRDTYVLQTAAAFSPAPAPVPAPEPSP